MLNKVCFIADMHQQVQQTESFRFVIFFLRRLSSILDNTKQVGISQQLKKFLGAKSHNSC